MQKKVGSFLIPYTKVNSVWIIDINLRAKTINLLEENILVEVNLYDLGLGNGSLDIIPKAQEGTTTTAHKDISDFIKLNTFVLQTIPTRKLKKFKEYKKIFANHINDMRLVFRIHKKLLSSIVKG